MNRTHRMLGVLGALILGGALVTGCSGGSSAPASTSTPSTVVTGSSDDVWYYVSPSEGWQVKVDLETLLADEPTKGPIDGANRDVIRGEIVAMRQYLQDAWSVPAIMGITDPERIAELWVTKLAPGGDRGRWVTGPLAQGPVTSGAEAAVSWRGDIRTFLWEYRPTESSALWWAEGVKYTYLIPRRYDGADPDNKNFGSLLIHRASDGALKAVYAPWGVEGGFTATGPKPGEDTGAFQALAVGVAKLVPATTAADDVLLLQDPAVIQAPLPGLGFFLFSGAGVKHADPAFGRDNPRWLPAGESIRL